MKHVSVAMKNAAWDTAENATCRYAMAAAVYTTAVHQIADAVQRRHGVEAAFAKYLDAKKKLAEVNEQAIGALEHLHKTLQNTER